MLEPPNATLALLLLAHVQAGVTPPQSLVDDVGGSPIFPPSRELCETCGSLLDDDVFGKCDDCVEATECENCGADVGTEEINRNGGACDDCREEADDEYYEGPV